MRAMFPAARLLAAWVAVTLVTVSTVARAQSAAPPPADLRLTAAESSQERQLQLRLDEVNGERASVGTTLPWAVIAVGIAAAVIGTTVAVARVEGCEQESCTSPIWPAWLVVGGITVSAGGVVWLRLVSEDIAAIETRRYHLQQQIDAYEVMREARGQRALLHVRATF